MSVHTSRLTKVNYARFFWNVAVTKYGKQSPAGVILAYNEIQKRKIAPMIGSMNGRVAWN